MGGEFWSDGYYVATVGEKKLGQSRGVCAKSRETKSKAVEIVMSIQYPATYHRVVYYNGFKI